MTLKDLSQKETDLLNLMTNDVKVQDLPKYLDISSTSVGVHLRNLRSFFKVETNHGLITEYLNIK